MSLCCIFRLILIFSKAWDDNTKNVKRVLYTLQKEKLYVNLFKCEFGKTALVYLGHIIGEGQLNIDPSKVDVVVKWPKPTNVAEVRIFLGVF